MVRLSDEKFDELRRKAKELGVAATGYLRILLRHSEIGEAFLTIMESLSCP